MSGLSRTPGKRVWANTHRGFESRPLRQGSSKHGPHGPFFFSYPRLHPRPFADVQGTASSRCRQQEARTRLVGGHHLTDSSACGSFILRLTLSRSNIVST